MNVTCLNVTDPRWEQLLTTLTYDFYHLPGYLTLEAKRLGGVPEGLWVSDGTYQLFLPYLLRSIPTELLAGLGHSSLWDILSPYGYPGFLLSPGAAQSPSFLRQALTQMLEVWRDRQICSAFIRLHPILNADLETNTHGLSFTANGTTVVVDLSLSQTELWHQTSSNHQRLIKRLQTTGFSARWADVQTHLPHFIEIYQETMDRVGASRSYYFDAHYYQQLSEILGDRLRLCVVEQGEEIVGAALFTLVGSVLQWHLSGTRSHVLKQSPSTLMIDYVRTQAKAEGYRWLHLGGGVGGSQDNLFKYKRRFSPRTLHFSTWRPVINPKLYQQVTQNRAHQLGISMAELQAQPFFPSYRTRIETPQSPKVLQPL